MRCGEERRRDEDNRISGMNGNSHLHSVEYVWANDERLRSRIPLHYTPVDGDYQAHLLVR